MQPLFFFGSLRDKPLLEVVLGRTVDDRHFQQAWAADHVALALAHEAYPYLAVRPGARAEGVVFTPQDQQDLERLTYFEEAEYGLAPIAATTATGSVDAVYFSAAQKIGGNLLDAAWDFDAWYRDERAVAIEAAAEMMAQFGIVPVDKIDDVWPGIMMRARMRARAKAETPVTGTLRAERSPGDVVSDHIGRPYIGYFALEQHSVRHRRFDGAMSEQIERTVMTSGDAVTMLPYDPVQDSVMLIEQFRTPMFARGDACPWGVEIIAGRIDQENDAEACARREAMEEGGVTLGAVEVIARYYSAPGFAAEHITSFVGHADLSDQGGVYGLASEHEDIRAFIVSLDHAAEGVASGEINNAPAILSILWLVQNRARLRAGWAGAAAVAGGA